MTLVWEEKLLNPTIIRFIIAIIITLTALVITIQPPSDGYHLFLVIGIIAVRRKKIGKSKCDENAGG